MLHLDLGFYVLTLLIHNHFIKHVLFSLDFNCSNKEIVFIALDIYIYTNICTKVFIKNTIETLQAVVHLSTSCLMCDGYFSASETCSKPLLQRLCMFPDTLPVNHDNELNYKRTHTWQN